MMWQIQDRLVYRNPDHPRRNYSALTTEDECFLVMVEMESSVGNVLWIKDLDRPARCRIGGRFQWEKGRTYRLFAYTSSDRLAIQGGSNGGLLVGAYM